MVLVRDGLALDVADASAGRFSCDVVATLARWDQFRTWERSAPWSGAAPVSADDLGPPVPAPRQVFAVALNYRPHADEAGFEPPEQPLVFTKFPSCITGPRAQVRLPAGRVDWEVEVVAVIGQGGRDIPREVAWDAVAGITAGQDISERVLQVAGTPSQFSLGKSHAGFGPIGPVAVSPDEFPDRDDIGFECRLGQQTVQSGRTADMIFGIDHLVAWLSTVCELLPGDLVFTGTPAGVGNRRNPPVFLKHGDVLMSTVELVGGIEQRFTH